MISLPLSTPLGIKLYSTRGKTLFPYDKGYVVYLTTSNKQYKYGIKLPRSKKNWNRILDFAVKDFKKHLEENKIPCL